MALVVCALCRGWDGVRREREGEELPGVEGQLIGSEVQEIYDPPEQSCVC